MHARVTVMIPRLDAAHFLNDVDSQIFRLHGWNTANVGSPDAVSLHSLMWDAAGIGRHRRRIDGRQRKQELQTLRRSPMAPCARCGSIDSQSDTDATMPDPDSPFKPMLPVRWAVPTNTHSSQGESQLYIFEDNEVVIKNDHQGSKSNNETCIQNLQSCS